MVPIAEKKPYPICPSCNSTDFYIDGFVLHRQPYNAKTSEYGVSEVEWDEDYPTAARCRNCDRDATSLFRKLDILIFYDARFTRR